MRVTFDEEALAEYIEWQIEDRKTLRRINALIQSIQREGFMVGIGKPEMLRGRNEFSRRIDDVNRLVYTSDAARNLVILSCKGHYDD
ncbi:MAG: Txe/YoeB family addiction module toxin [Dehalococcoidia bacterium]|nr:Txe/YoeB family addiction module toxin [Dehalococcoidia bacterium]